MGVRRRAARGSGSTLGALPALVCGEAELQELDSPEESDGERHPCVITELQVANLLSWARKQSAMKVHPGVVARGMSLVTSMAISRGTPLIGVMSSLYFGEQDVFGRSAGPNLGKQSATEAECQRLMQAVSEPTQWPLRLAVRLLRESNDPESPWQPHVRTLAPCPRAPLLWSLDKASELQYLPAKRALKEELLRFQRFFDTHFDGQTVMDMNVEEATLGSWVAAAASRAVEVEPGCHVLMPLMGLVCPPEALAFESICRGAEVPPASCVLTVEGTQEQGLCVLCAERNLQPGEVLTRDAGLSADELLLRHGLATSRNPVDDVVMWAHIGDASMKRWQLHAIERRATTEPGVAKGDVLIRSRVRRGRKLSQAIDADLLHSARVLACKREEDLYGVGEWAGDPVEHARGFRGVGSELRRACLLWLEVAVLQCLQSFETSIEEDEELLATLRGHRRTPVAYRLEKKRILKDVLQLLQDAKDKEVQRRAQRKASSGLPRAVTGRRQPVARRGFQVAGKGLSSAAASAAAAAQAVARGARVELQAGKYAGFRGTVTRDPDTFGTVAVKLESGQNVDFIKVDRCRRVDEEGSCSVSLRAPPCSNTQGPEGLA